MSSTKNIQYLDMIMGGVSPYRIDEADGAITGKTFDALYIEQDTILTTLTDSASGNMLTTSNITSNVNTIGAGMILRPAQGKTIAAVTVKSSDTGVVWGLTLPTPGV